MKDGGPAFPIVNAEGFPAHDSVLDEHVCSGLSLRDWFAGRALNGLLSANPPAASAELSGEQEIELMAKTAYALADAMLAEREKGDSR